jgi:hypothetical protein
LPFCFSLSIAFLWSLYRNVTTCQYKFSCCQWHFRCANLLSRNAEADGESTIIVPGAEYKEIARNTLGELCKASMAVAGKNIIIRGEHNLYCIGPAPADAAGE